MGTAPGSLKVIKAGFILLDVTGTVLKVLAFQYNPETLVRRLDGGPPLGLAGGAPSAPGGGVSSGVGGGISPAGGGPLGLGGVTPGLGGAGSTSSSGPSGAALAPAAVPLEFVSFTISLDATDKLAADDKVTEQVGLLPTISALELLMYPTPGSITVWVSGGQRILPVHISEILFNEQAFDPLLNPIRVDVSVHLQVLKDADFPNNPRGRAIWDAHYNLLQQLALKIDAVRLSDMGITSI
jgi:hypothetical protein